MNPWFVRSQSQYPERARLFCFPYAGNGASVFLPWQDWASRHRIGIYILQLPGRETRFREPLRMSFPLLLEELIEHIQPYLHPPVYFLGHSLGALLAYELAHALRALDFILPERLFLSGALPPDLVRSRPILHRLPDNELLEAVARQYQGIPQAALENMELRNLYLPILRADLTLFETYRYTPRPLWRKPMTIIGGRHDPVVESSLLDGWQQHALDPISLFIVEGNHFFINSSRAALWEILENGINRCPALTPGCGTLVPQTHVFVNVSAKQRPLL